jgi:hypothetical protein
MEVDQGPNWGCSTKRKKRTMLNAWPFSESYWQYSRVFSKLNNSQHYSMWLPSHSPVTLVNFLVFIWLLNMFYSKSLQMQTVLFFIICVPNRDKLVFHSKSRVLKHKTNKQILLLWDQKEERSVSSVMLLMLNSSRHISGPWFNHWQAQQQICLTFITTYRAETAYKKQLFSRNYTKI